MFYRGSTVLHSVGRLSKSAEKKTLLYPKIVSKGVPNMEYETVLGKLVLLKAYMTSKYHKDIDSMIDSVVTDYFDEDINVK